jgi:hypothetical protein
MGTMSKDEGKRPKKNPVIEKFGSKELPYDQFYFRIPIPLGAEFREILKKEKLSIYKGAEIAVRTFIEAYKKGEDSK